MKQEINYDLMLTMQIRVGRNNGYYPVSFFLPVRFIYLQKKRGPVLILGMVLPLVKWFLVKCSVQEESQEMYQFLKKEIMYHGLTTDFHMPSLNPGALHNRF